MTRETELAWLTGLIEADGYIGTHTRANGSRRFKIAVEMIDEDAVRRCKELTGEGHVLTYDREGKEGQNWKRTWKWQVQSTTAVQKVLTMLMPYVYTKRRRESMQSVLDGCNSVLK